MPCLSYYCDTYCSALSSKVLNAADHRENFPSCFIPKFSKRNMTQVGQSHKKDLWILPSLLYHLRGRTISGKRRALPLSLPSLRSQLIDTAAAFFALTPNGAYLPVGAATVLTGTAWRGQAGSSQRRLLSGGVIALFSKS